MDRWAQCEQGLTTKCDKNLPRRRDEQRRGREGGCATVAAVRVRRPVQLRHETLLTSEAYVAQQRLGERKSRRVSPPSARRLWLRAAWHVPAHRRRWGCGSRGTTARRRMRPSACCRTVSPVASPVISTISNVSSCTSKAARSVEAAADTLRPDDRAAVRGALGPPAAAPGPRDARAGGDAAAGPGGSRCARHGRAGRVGDRSGACRAPDARRVPPGRVAPAARIRPRPIRPSRGRAGHPTRDGA